MTIKKDRKHNMCGRKIVYRTEVEAKEGVAWMLDRRIYDQREPHAYPCEYGTHWHVGHSAKGR